MKNFFARRLVALAAAVGILVASAALLGFNAATQPHRVHSRAAHSTPTPSAQPSVTGTVNSSGASVVLQTTGVVLTPAAHLTFAGAGFSPGEMLTVTVMSSAGKVEAQLATDVADTDGNVTSASEVAPADLAPGPHLLMVKGEASQRTAQAEFQVQRLQPTVQLNTYSGEPGYTFAVSGSGFISNEPVDIFLCSDKGAPLAFLRATPRGDIAGQIKVPTRQAGEYPMCFLGRVSQTRASVAFDIQAFKSWVILDTYTPLSGSPLRFSGTDFAPSEQVLVYLTAPHGQPITTVQADTQGTFMHAGNFVVPDTLTGHQILVFVGQLSQASVTVGFEVFPKAELGAEKVEQVPQRGNLPATWLVCDTAGIQRPPKCSSGSWWCSISLLGATRRPSTGWPTRWCCGGSVGCISSASPTRLPCCGGRRPSITSAAPSPVWGFGIVAPRCALSPLSPKTTSRKSAAGRDPASCAPQ
jgi:hypothetical protein